MGRGSRRGGSRKRDKRGKSDKREDKENEINRAHKNPQHKMPLWKSIQQIYETSKILRSIFSTDSCLQSDNGVSTSKNNNSNNNNISVPCFLYCFLVCLAYTWNITWCQLLVYEQCWFILSLASYIIPGRHDKRHSIVALYCTTLYVRKGQHYWCTSSQQYRTECVRTLALKHTRRLQQQYTKTAVTSCLSLIHI